MELVYKYAELVITMLQIARTISDITMESFDFGENVSGTPDSVSQSVSQLKLHEMSSTQINSHDPFRLVYLLVQAMF